MGKATTLKALQATSCAGKDPCLHKLHLDTKYYTADLLVHCQDVHSSKGSSHPALDQLQAVVLVIDASSRQSYDDIMAYHKCLEGCEYDIQLLVANKLDSLQQQGQDSSNITRPAWLEDARSWCYSNGFEYIEAASGKPAVDATLHEDGEQQGVARLLAALQAHMWPNMQPKPRSQHAHGVTAAAGSSSAAGSSRTAAGIGSFNTSSAVKDQDPSPQTVAVQEPQQPQQHQQQHSPEQPADHAGHSSSTVADALPKPKQQQASTAGHQAAAAGAGKGQLSQEQQQQQPGASPVLDLDDNPFMDADMDDFEQLMRQVMGK